MDVKDENSKEDNDIDWMERCKGLCVIYRPSDKIQGLVKFSCLASLQTTHHCPLLFSLKTMDVTTLVTFHSPYKLTLDKPWDPKMYHYQPLLSHFRTPSNAQKNCPHQICGYDLRQQPLNSSEFQSHFLQNSTTMDMAMTQWIGSTYFFLASITCLEWIWLWSCR